MKNISEISMSSNFKDGLGELLNFPGGDRVNETAMDAYH